MRNTLWMLASLALLGCGGSSGGGSDDDGIPPLPEPSGALQEGRYQPLGDDQAILLDTYTQLAWQRCPQGMNWNKATLQCDGAANSYSWNDAVAIELEGFRLPTVDELASLVYCSDSHQAAADIGTNILGAGCSEQAQSPMIKSAQFPAITQRTYWTRSASLSNSASKLGINFAFGRVSDFNAVDASYPVLLVRDASQEISDEVSQGQGS
ncbi:hypothetical protein GCM10011297_30110 [Bacterioplanes sanyensis]|uniref:Lcl C-terminal domain-containing protein n=1 Tax=Bacterioplanes sanyensis TaxID=1249553 RepID=UPI001672296E|nr:DUF1566 domain-containing protein [Bacterioplanes sanyensis]GGY55345.1 hypothetical protein GCM10011297_30110 [Bacterioplanes sanyensis]